MVMAKGRGGRKREAKKPKGGNKPVQASTTFLPPSSTGPKTAVKETSK
jgi:hypothetical protein